MKRTSLFFRSIIAFSFAIFAFASCDDGTTGGSSSSAPILELLDSTGALAGDATVAPGQTMTFTVKGTSSGDNPMKNVRFLEGGSLVENYDTRITVNGSSAISNSIALFNDDKNSFEWTVTWDAHTSESALTYEVEIIDDGGNKDKESFTINTVSETVLGVTLLANGNSVSADATLTAGAYMRVTLDAVKGSSPISALEIREENDPIDVSRLYYDDVNIDNQFLANPVAIEGEAANGFTQDILVKIHETEGITRTYAFLISDSNEGWEYVQISITTEVTTPVTTPITGNLTAKLLFNADGPVGKGALDLDFGDGTGVSTDNPDTGTTPTEAEIKDMGIDGDGNWLKQIAPMNNATLKRVDNDNAEITVVFSTTTDKETILAAYNDPSSVSVTEAAPSGVTIGDLFVIQRNDIYYLIECKDIVDETGNADDYYQFDIKY